MALPAAYLGVILIWSTTPLAIQWSSAGWGFLVGLSGRMLLGTLLCIALIPLLRQPLPWHRAARRTYAAAGVGVFGAMFCVYWGAQFLPSGLIAVIFGLNPLLTGFIASLWLKERGLTPGRLLGIALGIAGLLVIFNADVVQAGHAWVGALAVFCSVLLHSLSAVWVKRIGAGLSGLTVTSGSLISMLPLFVLSWALLDGEPPRVISLQAGLALLYLGLFGSVLGFTLYYYLLKHLEANRVALITLITPVLALLIGQWLNGEHIAVVVWIGSGLIIAGLASHLWVDRLLVR